MCEGSLGACSAPELQPWQCLLPAEGQEPGQGSQQEPCRVSGLPCWVGHEFLCHSRALCGGGDALTLQNPSLALLWNPSRAASSDWCGCRRSSFSWLIRWRASHGGRRRFWVYNLLAAGLPECQKEQQLSRVFRERKGKPTAFSNSPRCWKSVF